MCRGVQRKNDQMCHGTEEAKEKRNNTQALPKLKVILLLSFAVKNNVTGYCMYSRKLINLLALSVRCGRLTFDRRGKRKEYLKGRGVNES